MHTAAELNSPLRQLYGLGFPHLYQWARYQDPNQGNPFSASRVPAIDVMRVERWINLYRSADYVGRALWRDELGTFGVPARLQPLPQENLETDATHTRLECCTGAGAHTHYWQPDAPLVPEALDTLIRANGMLQ